MLRKERQDTIQAWGFNCSCHTCSLSKGDSEISDERVRLIKQYRKELRNWSTYSLATPSMAEELISLYEAEGLFVLAGSPYRLAAQAYSAVGDRIGAMKYAIRAIDHGLLAWTTMGRTMKDTIHILMDPEHHWTWRKRVTEQ